MVFYSKTEETNSVLLACSFWPVNPSLENKKKEKRVFWGWGKDDAGWDGGGQAENQRARLE